MAEKIYLGYFADPKGNQKSRIEDMKSLVRAFVFGNRHWEHHNLQQERETMVKFRFGILVLMFFLILLPVSAFANTWTKTYINSRVDSADSIQETSDNGFIVAGNSQSTNYSDYWVLKLDANGNVVWQKTYGSSSYDYARSIQETSDNGFIVAGYTAYSSGYDSDYWVLKLDANGNVVWQKTYGSSSYDYARSIQETSDNGFIVAGYTAYSSGYDSDYWVLKLDANGNVVWQKTYGGFAYDYASSIQETSDNGFIVAGYTYSYGAGGTDYWVLKLDANGNVIWQKTYGGSSFDEVSSIQETSDNGFIVAGSTDSYGAGSDDYWVLKLDANGNVVWQKTYGGFAYDYASSIQETSDNGFIVAGYTYSYGAGGTDYWVLKLDANGNVIWQKTYGGSSTDIANSIQETSDNGFIVAGYTYSYGAGYSDYWILKLDANGNVIWQKTYGGSIRENARSIQETSDNGFIVAGVIQPYYHWSETYFWVLKLDANGIIPNCDLIGDSSAAGNNTNTIPTNTSVTPQIINATVTNTTIDQIITEAFINERCSGDRLPFYRLYNPYTYHHHYTTDANEYNVLKTLGWFQEGPACYLYDKIVTIDSVDAVPYLRLYNTNSHEHHWTTDANEYHVLGTIGWIQEGADGFVFASQVSGSEPLYRLYNPNDGLHHWTMDSNERIVLISRGFIDEGIACYVFTWIFQ